MKTGQHPSLTSLQETGHYIISEKPVEQHIPNKGMRFDYSRDSSRTTVPNVCTSRPSQSASTTKKKKQHKAKVQLQGDDQQINSTDTHNQPWWQDFKSYGSLYKP